VNRRPVVLFACVHNSGRSVAAEALLRHRAGDAIEVRSAGSEPGGGVDLTDLAVRDAAPQGIAVDGGAAVPEA
jgi:arsenate reductase